MMVPINRDVSRVILFEPWALGDALIAAWACRQIQVPAKLFVHSRYRALVEAVTDSYGDIEVHSVDLSYTAKGRGKKFFKDLKTLQADSSEPVEVYSIRGDFRDYLAAKKIFPRAKIKMCGWLGFFARRIPVVDKILVQFGVSPKNRYASWSSQLQFKIPSKSERRIGLPAQSKVLIHVGAQWKSRVYPSLGLLGQSLAERGYEVTFGYGPGDSKPDTHLRTAFLDSENILTEFRNHPLIITNDSAPMHLGSLLGNRVLVVCNISNICEWIPPDADYVASPTMPRGYRPKREYMSDVEVADWPPVEQVLLKIESIVSGKNEIL